MVLTKENVAAHAFAEHLVALQLLQKVQQKISLATMNNTARADTT